ncbi:FecR family protein [Asticcacaulis sp. AC466]|uniref:FecR family protein n=1 Tax=Asticcacaulis sp. AC466 TaxID=1282362 RepID=UPI00041F1092|nr:FecR domain-containing protein [Asticcacaulis sp. AC466]
MTPPHPIANAIDDQAAEWVARLDANPDDTDAFQAWLASDPRCFGAYARARAIYLSPQVGDALQAQRLPQAGELTRRSAMAAIAASVIGGLFFLWPRAKPAPVRLYDSVLGEVRVIPLEDGSRITLNTDTALTVEYSKTARRIHLMRGEAYFEVAKAPDRPFVVTGPMAQVRTVGTAYTVRLVDPAEMKVRVTSGRVALESPPSRLAQSLMALTDAWGGFGASESRASEKSGVFVDPDQEAIIRLADAKGDGGQVLINISTLPSEAIQQALLWREGQLSFAGDRLADAVAEFARYSPRRIVIRDKALERERISGLFAVKDVEGFARAAAVSLGANIKTNGDELILYR